MAIAKLHPDNSVLQAFLDDQLDAAQVETVTNHLNDCNACQLSMDKLSNGHSNPLTETLRTLKTIDEAQRLTSIGGDDEEPKAVVFQGGKKYLLLSELARGGMGIVFRGYDPELNRDIAIKIMNPAMKICAEDVIRFQREARLAGQLQHPGIVPIHELGCLPDGRTYIAMRLVEGTTLRELMDQGTASSQQTSHLLEVFNQIGQTIAYAHSKNIIHRDLKPENVMVGTFGEVQVMDWGLAKQIDSISQEATGQRNVHPTAEFIQTKSGDVFNSYSNSHSSANRTFLATQTGTVFGTPAYMSPRTSTRRIY